MNSRAASPFSLESADRAAIRTLIVDLVRGASTTYVLLDTSKGANPLGTLSLHLASASGAARHTFAGALDDLIAHWLGVGQLHNIAEADNVLNLLEVALVRSIELREPQCSTLVFSIGQMPELTTSAARVLGYPQTVHARRAIEELRLRSPHSAELTASVVRSRTLADPFSALEVLGGWAQPLTPALELALEAAVVAMFERDGLFAKRKISYLAPAFSAEIKQSIAETLNDVALRDDRSATAALKMLQAERPTSSDAPSGIVARIIKRNAFNVLGGYSMRAASHERSSPHVDPWMKAMASHALRILKEQYPQASSIGTGDKFQQWPRNEASKTVFDRLLTRTIPGLSLPDTTDICFEIMYLSSARHEFNVVKLGTLKTLTIIYHQANNTVMSRLRGIRNPSPSDLENMLRRWTWEDGGESQHIYSPLYTSANDVVGELLNRKVVKASHRHELDPFDGRLAAMLDGRADRIILCDNVTANDILARLEGVAAQLQHARVLYPEPVPVGLGFDVTDDTWGEILQAALETSLLDRRDEVIRSFQELRGDFNALDIAPAGAFARYFTSENLERIDHDDEQT